MALVRWSTGFGGWLFQVSWAPQHVASAMLVVLACILLASLPSRRGLLLPVVLGLTVAAGFESSAWVGGVTFALAVAAIGPALLAMAEPQQRAGLIGRAAVAAVVALLLAIPFLRDQFATTVIREAGSPIMLAPVQVLGTAIAESVRRFLDLPAYWLIHLPLEFPAFYPVGVVALAVMLKERLSDERSVVMPVLGLLTGVSLCAAWLLVSVVGDNNDLGWRAVLPAVLLLIAFAAAGIARWLAKPALLALAAAGGLALLGLVDSAQFIRDNVAPQSNPSARIFATTPALWQAVRKHAAENDRIANNPNFMRDMTPWPVNISWALLANRRSCYAGYELAVPFAPVSGVRRAEIDARFLRVFEGSAAPDDVAQLAQRQLCDVAVVTAQDGAWSRDPFAASGSYRLVESRPGAWRIYLKNP
jgi:hypothetical protein